MKKIKLNKKNILTASVLIALLIGVIFAVELVLIIKDLPKPEKITDIKPVQSTKIYDRTGEILLYEIHGNENRTVISYSEIPEYAKLATLAIEDKDFYNHSAIDIRAIIRAFFTNLIKGGVVQGGSTITQQLVKNTFLEPDRTIKRKIKELVIAYWLEKHYTKNEILELYFNQISYGSNAYGIESASKLYFGKNAKDLALAESAMLASLIKAPSYYSPWGKHKNELMARKDYVLDQMKELGFIDSQELIRAKSEQLKILDQNIGFVRAPHFSMMVKNYLENKYGEEIVSNGGLNVITTLDLKLQEIAEQKIKEGAERNKELYKGENASMVAQDPKTGQILALVGSADYFNNEIDGQFNVATQGLRHPGSAFKPFAYLTAFMKGYTPDTIVFDVPTEFSAENPDCPLIVDFNNLNKSCFHPRNFDETFRGPTQLKQALAQSINVPSVKVLYLAGLQDTINNAAKMGMTTLNDVSRYGLSLVLGGGEVKLTDLVNAYSVFAQDGIKRDQSFILKLEDNSGNVMEEYRDNAVQVIEPQYARMINNILSDSNLRSGLLQSSLYLTIFDGYEVALKTGTTNDYRDAWVIGYTPFLTVGVWAGNSNYKPMEKQGGSILAAVPIWSSFLKEVINNFKPETFISPESMSSAKPMLNGLFVTNTGTYQSPNFQVHSVLYYTDKNDLQKEFLKENPNPGQDSQFINWEIPVIEWAKNNIPNFSSSYNK